MPIDIQINDNSFDSVIKGFDYTFKGIQIESNAYCSKINLPSEIGTGTITQRQFKTGISVMDFRAYLHQAVSLHYSQGLLHPLKIIINKKGRIKHQFHDRKKPDYLNEQGSVTMASIAKQKHSVFLPQNQHLSLLSIRIDRKAFEDNIQYFSETMEESLSKVFRDVNGVNPYYFEGYYNHKTTKLTELYFNNKYTGFIENLYLEGLVYQLLGIQLDTILKSKHLSNKERKKTYKFHEQILQVSRILKSDIASFSTVNDLSKLTSISSKKLQKGFKELFGMTVLEYVNDFKIESARALLLETDLTVAEISYELGINSPAYLSKLFKKKYDVNPKQYRSSNN